MSSSYIVEVWNKNGLYAGPGQVFAAHPRKAAITVMRNIGRPQLSAGGTTPYVIHVQDLDSGVEKHYGWSAKHLQGGATGDVTLKNVQVIKSGKDDDFDTSKGTKVNENLLEIYKGEHEKNEGDLTIGPTTEVGINKLADSYHEIVMGGTQYIVKDLAIDTLFVAGDDGVYTPRPVESPPGGGDGGGAGTPSGEGGAESGGPSDEEQAAAAAKAEAAAKAQNDKLARAQKERERRGLEEDETLARYREVRENAERRAAAAESIIDLIRTDDQSKLTKQGPDIIIQGNPYSTEEEAKDVCEACKDLFQDKDSSVTFEPLKISDGQFQIKISRT